MFSTSSLRKMVKVKALEIPLFLCCIMLLGLALICGSAVSLPQFLFVAICSSGTYIIFAKRGVPRRFPLLLFVGSLTVCLVLASMLDNPIVSDFLVQYQAAYALACGDPSLFDTEYFAKYPYQIGWTLAECALLQIYNSPALIKAFCCLCVSLTVLLSFLITRHLTNEVVGATIGCGIALYPTIALMPGACSNQPLSTLFCFIGIFILVFKMGTRKNWRYLILAGACFGFAEMIRPDVIVIVLAVIATIFIKDSGIGKSWHLKTGEKAVRAFLVFGSYKLMALALSSAIVAAGVVGSFDSDVMYKIALGTNLDSRGSWSSEVFDRIEAYVATGMDESSASFAVVEENLSTLSESGNAIALLAAKNNNLWWNSGFYFSTLNAHSSLYNLLLNVENSMLLAGILLCLLSIIMVALETKPTNNAFFLLLTIFTVALASYQIIEVQSRYLYTDLFIVFILAGCGLSRLKEATRLTLLRFKARNSHETPCTTHDLIAITSQTDYPTNTEQDANPQAPQ